MKISKLLWEYNKDRPQGEIDMEAIQGRAIGKTTAYCLRLIVEAMERPEQRVEIKNEPYTIDNYHTQRNVEIQVGKLIEDMKLDWMVSIREGGKSYICYRPYVKIKKGYVLDE